MDNEVIINLRLNNSRAELIKFAIELTIEYNKYNDVEKNNDVEKAYQDIHETISVLQWQEEHRIAYKEGRLSKDQIEKLDSIDFDWVQLKPRLGILRNLKSKLKNIT